MTKNHLKARAAPRTWNIPRKADVFVTRPNPGSQSMERTLPLNLFLKQAGLGNTRKEITHILTSTEVHVNGVRRHDGRFGVGLFDVVAVPSVKQFFVLVLDTKGRLAVQGATEKEATAKLARIQGVTLVAGGKYQLSFDDGHTLIADKKNYVRGATAVIALDKKAVKAVHALEVKAHVLLTSGKHRGTRGVVSSITNDDVIITTKSGEVVTKTDYAFVVVPGVAGGNE